MSDDDKSCLSSFFTSIRDRFHYQACDRSGTFSSEMHDIFAKLIYDNEEYRSRHLHHFGNHAQQHRNDPEWREQFDHASKDFLSSLGHNRYECMMNNLKSECLTRAQKWWDLFGRYWLVLNRHNDDDTKLMGWLINGVCHGTVDTCGENAAGSFTPLHDCDRGSRLLISGAIDNHSKLLKMELGQQISIKSKQKMKRDIMKHALASCCQQIHTPFHNSCWLSSHSRVDYSVPNTQNGFFDACVLKSFITLILLKEYSVFIGMEKVR